MPITLLDLILLIVMLISGLLAMIRGFIREVLSIAAWVIAAVAAYALYDDALPFIRQYIRQEYVDVAIAVAGIFFLTLIAVSIITMKISDFVIDSRIGFIDRTLGFVFGAARGILLAVVGVVFFNWLVAQDNRPRWMIDATSYPLLTQLGDDLVAALPEDPEAAILETLDARFRNGPRSPQAAPVDPVGYDSDQQQGLDQLIESTGEDEPAAAGGAAGGGGGQATPPPRPAN